MSIISLPIQLTDGTVADAAQVMANLNAIVNDYNGNINNNNLSSTIAITDSHLNQIQTAGKVNATALTNLAGIPSGAGVVPAANLLNAFPGPILSVSNTSTQSVGGSSWIQRTFGTVNEDSGGYWASNTYTPLVAGWYFVSYTDGISNTSTGTQNSLAIYKTGSLYNQCSIAWPSAWAVGNDIISGTVTAIVQCNGSTDTIAFYCYSTSSVASAQGTGYSYASIFRIF